MEWLNKISVCVCERACTCVYMRGHVFVCVCV